MPANQLPQNPCCPLKAQPCAVVSDMLVAWQLEVNVMPYGVVPGLTESGARMGAACTLAFAPRRPRPGQIASTSPAGMRYAPQLPTASTTATHTIGSGGAPGSGLGSVSRWFAALNPPVFCAASPSAWAESPG